MKSVQQMCEQCEALLGTKDVSEWESSFLASVLEQHRAGRSLSPKQADVLVRIYEKHYA